MVVFVGNEPDDNGESPRAQRAPRKEGRGGVVEHELQRQRRPGHERDEHHVGVRPEL